MSTSDNLLTNQAMVANTTYWTSDKVIFSTTTTLTVTNTVSASAQTFSVPTPINQLALPVGIFSTDGGNTWNDYIGIYNLGSLSSPITPPNVSVYPSVAGNGTVTFNVVVNALVGSGSTFPLICSICLLATSTPSSMSSIPIVSSGTTKTAFTNTSAAPASPISYRRIISDLSFVVATGSTTLNTYAHGLGYVPDLLMLGYGGSYGNNVVLIGPTALIRSGGILASFGSLFMYMDSTNLYYFNSNDANTYLIRLYKP